MAMVEDLSPFFDTGDFAVVASFTSRSGNSSTITGIFDDEFVSVAGDGMAEIAATDPIFTCRTIDVPNARGGQLVLHGTIYNIVTAKPDGTGITMLALEEAD